MRAYATNIDVLPRKWLEERKQNGTDRFDEVWDDVLHVPKPLDNRHQELTGHLAAYLLYHWAYPNGRHVVHQVNVTLPDLATDWRRNYRIPDIVMSKLDAQWLGEGDCLVEAPDALVEICALGDETYDKLPFYAQMGAPEVWIIRSDTKKPEIHVLQNDGIHKKRAADEKGWLLSSVIGVEMKSERRGKLTLRMKGKPTSSMTIPR